ncbi:MAG: DUF2194 domain-containing protein, partial [Candidatus Spyradocola sp.]
MSKKTQIGEARPRKGGYRRIFTSLVPIALLMCLLMFVLITAARNVTYTATGPSLALLDVDKSQLEHAAGEAECLLLYEDDAAGIMGYQEMSAVLEQMKVRFDALECSQAPEGLGAYRYLVLSVTHYQHLGELLGEVKSWVKAGGNLMILYPPDINGSFESLFEILGIRDCGSGNVYVDTLRFAEGFLLGGDTRDFPIIDAYESSMGVSIEADCEVFAQSVDEYPIPIIWRRRVGEGTVVVDNLGFLDKAYRGLHASAYSLLGDACIYPVINASAFYIDDFPSPVPSGSAEYILRDYNLSIRDFYTSKW